MYSKWHKRKKNYKKQILGKPKSKFEESLAEQIAQLGIPVKYETERLEYIQPAQKRKYLIDFDLGPFLVEAKGYLTTEERKKLIWIKESINKELRIVFQNASLPIYKGSKTTYGDWATKQGFKWAEERIPKEWLTEAKEWWEKQKK